MFFELIPQNLQGAAAGPFLEFVGTVNFQPSFGFAIAQALEAAFEQNGGLLRAEGMPVR